MDGFDLPAATIARPWFAGWHTLVRAALVASILVAGIVTVLLWLRRGSAGFPPLPAGSLLCCGLALAAVGLGWRQAWLASRARQISPSREDALFIGLSVLLFALAALLTVPGTKSWHLLGLWAPVLIVDGWWWWWRRSSDRRRMHRPIRRMAAAADDTAAGAAEEDELFDELHEDLHEELLDLDPDVSQRIVRMQRDREDVLSGEFRCWFEASQRIDALHVAFCPPFAGAPLLDVTQLDGPEATFKPIQIQPYGLKLEVRLTAPARARSSIVLHLLARRGEQ